MDVDGLLLWIATILILIYPEKHEEESKNKKPAKRISKSSPAKKSAAAKKAARSRKLKQKPQGDFVKEPETVHDLMKERLKQ